MKYVGGNFYLSMVWGQCLLQRISSTGPDLKKRHELRFGNSDKKTARPTMIVQETGAGEGQ